MTPIEQCATQHNPEGDDMNGTSQEKRPDAQPDSTSESLQGHSFGQLLSAEWSDITAGSLCEADAIDLTLCFQGGLVNLDRKGLLLPAHVEIEVQICPIGSDGREIGEWSHLLTKQWSMAQLGKYEERITLTKNGRHRVRARRSLVGGDSVIDAITVQKARRQ